MGSTGHSPPFNCLSVTDDGVAVSAGWLVVQGAAEFFGDLTRALRYNHQYFPSAEAPYTFDYIRVKSYEGTESTGRGMLYVVVAGCFVW